MFNPDTFPVSVHAVARLARINLSISSSEKPCASMMALEQPAGF